MAFAAFIFVVLSVFAVVNSAPVVRPSLMSSGHDVKSSNLNLNCATCKLGISLLRTYAKSGKSNKEITATVTNLCVTLNLLPARICKGVMDSFVGEVMYVLRHVNYTNQQICAFFLGGHNDCVDESFLDTFHWELDVSDPPPLQPVTIPRPGSPSLRILHMSDLHLDTEYHIGAVVDCGEPLCCRAENGLAASNETAAGKWGAIGDCDSPIWTIDNMLAFIRDTIKPDYVIWTGDVPPHDVWRQSKEGNIVILRELVRTIKEHLPGIPVYPAVGNHEADPVNSFPIEQVYHDYSSQYLYNALNENWKDLVPSLPSETVLKGGFYSVFPRPGLRLISLNMNYCNNKNWWLLLNSTDPSNELTWLIKQLQSAERNNEKVHIIGHIPPGNADCNYFWSWNFNIIVNRYRNVITGQFYGHTHKSEFQIHYDEETAVREAVSVSHVGPSVTPYDSVNPAFRVYTVDGDYPGSSWDVLDFETYYLDLNEANANDNPQWKRLFSVKDSYGLSSFHPSEWDSFVNRMNSNDTLFRSFYSHWHRNAKTDDDCDAKCKTDMLCQLKTAWTGAELLCDRNTTTTLLQ